MSAPMTRPWIAAAIALAACAPPRPSIGGRPAAPSTPDSYWSPPSGEIAALPSVTRPPTQMPNLGRLSLADVVDLSLRNNPATRISWAQALTAADEYGAARGALFPSLTADASVTRSLSLSRPTIPAGERTQYGPSLGLSYLVFDFGGRGGRSDGARKKARAASLTHHVAWPHTLFAPHVAALHATCAS